MPVAYKPNATFETGRVSRDLLSIEDETFQVAEISESIIDEMLDISRKQEKLEKEKKENIKKIEKLKLHISAAKEALSKAEEKEITLININKTLKERIDAKQQNIDKALYYWHDIVGLDVTQLSTDKDDYELYNFHYLKLSKSKRNQQQQGESNDNSEVSKNHDGSKEQFNYKVGIKHHDNKLTIVSQDPELITSKEIEAFNEELTQACISSSDEGSNVDYKLAVLKIKKNILKCP